MLGKVEFLEKMEELKLFSCVLVYHRVSNMLGADRSSSVYKYNRSRAVIHGLLLSTVLLPLLLPSLLLLPLLVVSCRRLPHHPAAQAALHHRALLINLWRHEQQHQG